MKKPFKNMINLIIASIVACVYLVWTPDQDLVPLKEKYAQAPSKFINLAGTNLHYRDSGNKNLPTLVFYMALGLAYIHGKHGLAN